MNNKGFGIKDFIIIIAVMFISIIIAMSLYNQSIASLPSQTNEETVKSKTYEDLTDELLKAAERYQNDNYSANSDEQVTWILKYSLLRKEKYLSKIYDIKDKKIECTGYVEFNQDKAEISYKPFLKCGDNYKTKGYEEENN
ncbi:MAG: hypothetical protein PUA73_02375 [Bacilli bacterium]|nr:hypothetical protein [Bacilli bacterium]